MENYQTWRDLLAALIKRSREKIRLAKLIGVSELTLQLWTTHAGHPNAQQRQQLIQALPQHAMLLRTLLAEEFPDLAIHDEAISNSQLEFSARIFDIHASAPDESRYWSICAAVLSEAVQQLDPRQLGISLSVIQCMAPPRISNVRYLRECATLGTFPWPSQIEFRTSFLGAESLAGRAVAEALPQLGADCRRELSTTYLPEYTVSAIALPILHSGRVAGCLLATSTQPDYFSTPERTELLQSYAALLKLAFSPADFYPLEQVELQCMPPLQIQHPYLSSFQQRLLATLKTAFTGNRSLNYLEAQHYVWGQIAEELLQLQTPQL